MRRVRTEVAVFWITLLITWVVGAWIQLWMLPEAFPELYAGEGLFKAGDWMKFHSIAATVSQKMHAFGLLKAWSLRPLGQAPSGIAALIYTYIAPTPLALLPLNAALHALGAWALYRIIRPFARRDAHAVLAIMPYVFLPSNIVWTAQISKEGYFVTGNLLFLLGLLRLSREPRARSTYASLIGGAVLVWLVRPYSLLMLEAMLALAMVGPAFTYLRARLRREAEWPSARACGAFASVVVVALFTLARGQAVGGAAADEDPGMSTRRIAADPTRPAPKWQPSPVLPAAIDRSFAKISQARERLLQEFPYPHQSVDIERRFDGVASEVAYVPRALVVGLLYPFPDTWFNHWTFTMSWPMLTIPPWIFPFEYEMALAYFLLAGLPLAAFMSGSARREFWIVAGFCVGWIVFLALTHPHISSLYRKRYAFEAALMALGGLGWLGALSVLRRSPATHHRPGARR